MLFHLFPMFRESSLWNTSRRCQKCPHSKEKLQIQSLFGQDSFQFPLLDYTGRLLPIFLSDKPIAVNV